ncbi:MAG: N-acetyltransferase [Symbiobacteriaceae bacterium]|nr:N-acetyltransferase [Symbiobacteriaceae bacterium]
MADSIVFIKVPKFKQEAEFPMSDAFQIRPFDHKTDYHGMAQLSDELYERHVTVESLKDSFSRRDPKCAFAAWVAEVDGEFAGMAVYEQFPGSYHPRKFVLDVDVRAPFRRRGIGGALYRQLREALAPHDPIALGAGTKENWPEAITFLENRGFKEKMRTWESHFDLTGFDPSALGGHVTAAEAAGFEFRSYADLAGDPERDQKLYEMVKVARRDIPSPEPLTDVSFEQWKKGIDRPQFFPETYIVAIKEGQMVGQSNIWKTHDAEVLETGLTAVLREHRRAGLAKALKIQSLAAAKAAGGYRKVKTRNATTNAPMLAINEWLGFVRQPAWIAYSLELHPEE